MDTIYIIEDEEETINKGNNIFPWLGKITSMCKETILEPSIEKLDKLIGTFLEDVEKNINQCYCQPKMAEKLKTKMNSLLIFFHKIYLEFKKPLEHVPYLDKISAVMAIYIDLELKSSKCTKEDPKKISERLCSCLLIFLDKSIEHMLDAVLKSRYFGKPRIYTDICEPIIARLLKESPGYLNDASYVRYILAFKLWKKLAGKERSVAINKEVILKLKPPPDFVDKLKSGAFADVLPHVPKQKKDRLTLFLMRSPFNAKKKAQVFLKDSSKYQLGGEIDILSMEDDFECSNLFEYNDSDHQERGSSYDIMNNIWNNLVDKEANDFEDLFCSDSLEEEHRMMIDLKSVSVENSLEFAVKGVLKSPPKFFKMEHTENNILPKNSPGKPNCLLDGTLPKEENTITSCVAAEETLNNSDCKRKRCLTSDTVKIKKPCATVEPEKCKEMEADSQSKIVIHRTIPTSVISSTENSNSDKTNARHLVETVSEQESHIVDSSENNHSENISPGIVHSSEVDMCTTEEVDKLKTNTNDHATSISEEKVVEYNDEVAEEIEIDNTSDVPLDILMDEDLQSNKLDQKMILKVIGDPNELIPVPITSINAEMWKETLNTKDASPVQKLNDTSVDKTGANTNNTKSTTSSENQFLSSIVASTAENCDNYVSLRQDSYTCNDLMLTQLFSEVNADEGSDDEQRFHNQRQYASGGKIRAFRDQTEESKSESEEFETHSPASHPDSIKSVVEASPESNQMNSICPPIVRFDEEQISLKLNQEKEAAMSEANKCPIKSNLDCPQLKRVSVDVSYTTESDSNNPVLVNNEEISPTGMLASPDAILHTKTIVTDFNYEIRINNLFSLSHSSCDPNRPFVAPPTLHSRCRCMVCTDKYMFLVSKYQQLLIMISYYEDARLSKLQETQAQQEQLLKTIQDSLNENGVLKEKPNEEKEKSMDTDNDPLMMMDTDNDVLMLDSRKQQSSNSDKDKHILDMTREDSSLCLGKTLPPKKRILKVRNSEHSEVPNVESTRKNFENNINESVEEIQDTSQNESTKKDSISNVPIKKSSPVKLKAIQDGIYCVIPQMSPNADDDMSNKIDNDNVNTKTYKTKSCCYRKRKEEKKLRREKKRLKRERRNELMDKEVSS